MNKYLDAPKIKRTHCYAMLPTAYDIVCPICGEGNITWSEFEKHIWCYSCEKDVYIDLYHSGIFSGPIPWQITHLLGIHFGRINLETDEVFHDDDPNYDDLLNKSFVNSDELNEWEKKFEYE